MAGASETVSPTEIVDEPTETFDISDDAELLEAVGKQAEPAAAEPEKPAVVAEPVAPAGDKDAALRAERGKRKDADNRWKAVEEEKRKLEASLALRRPGLPNAGKKIEILSAADLSKLKDEGDKLETFGDVAVMVAKEMATRMGTHLESVTKQANDAIWEMNMATLEGLAKVRHQDFDTIVKASGLAAGLAVNPQTGRVADEVLARQVFSKPDPAEELYSLAYDKLESEGKLEEVLGLREPAPVPAPAPRAAKPAAPAAPAAPEAVVAAREAEAAVTRKVLDNSRRPRGIAAVPDAGTPTHGRLSHAQIDALPDAEYQKLMERRPDIRVWHLGGSSS